MQVKSDDSLSVLCRRIAIHEGGHAVPALALGELSLERMTLTVDQAACSAKGLTLVKRHGHSARHMRAWLVSLLGGRVAEHVLLGDVWERLSMSDSDEAVTVAKEICQGDEFAARDLMASAAGCAMLLVQANRSLLELLAGRLQSELVLNKEGLDRAAAAFPPVIP